MPRRSTRPGDHGPRPMPRRSAGELLARLFPVAGAVLLLVSACGGEGNQVTGCVAPPSTTGSCDGSYADVSWTLTRSDLDELSAILDCPSKGYDLTCPEDTDSISISFGTNEDGQSMVLLNCDYSSLMCPVGGGG